MKLNSFKYHSHSLNFRKSFDTSTHNLLTRRIFIVELSDKDGNTFYGEAAPLPQFNSETYLEVESELKKLAAISEFEVGDSVKEIHTNIKSMCNLSSVKYALEHIFYFSLFNQGNIEIENHFSERRIQANAVVGIDDFEKCLVKVSDLVKLGYKVIKLKTDEYYYEDLHQLLSWAKHEFSPQIKFRIDPNCSWRKKFAIEKINELKLFPIEYIEQPVENEDDLIELAEQSPIPIAADESIRTLEDAEKLINNSQIKYLVIKPMLFGGIGNISELLKLVIDKNIQLVISSSLESNIGRRHLVLSSAFVDNNLAHGLATADMFENQPTSDVFPAQHGEILFTPDKYLSELSIHK